MVNGRECKCIGWSRRRTSSFETGAREATIWTSLSLKLLLCATARNRTQTKAVDLTQHTSMAMAQSPWQQDPKSHLLQSASQEVALWKLKNKPTSLSQLLRRHYTHWQRFFRCWSSTRGAYDTSSQSPQVHARTV